MDDGDEVGVDAENFVGDLGHGGLHALAVGVHADIDLEAAVRGHPALGLLEARDQGSSETGEDRGSVRRLFGEHSDADTDAAAVRLSRRLALAHRIEADAVHGAAQALGVIAGIQVFVEDVGVGHHVRRHEIFLPHLMRFAANLAGDGVDGELGGKAHTGAGNAAVGDERRLVGGHRKGLVTADFEPVGAGQVAAGHRRLDDGGKRPHGIGADVDGDLDVGGQDLALFIGIGRDFVMVLAAVGTGHQMLAAVLYPAHRMPELPGQPGDGQLLGLHDALVAKAATDVGRDDPHLPLLELQMLGDAGADEVGRLRRRIDDELAHALVPVGETPRPFHGIHGLARHVVRARHLDGRRLGHGIDIVVTRRDHEDVVAPLLVDQRRAGFLGVNDVGEDRQLVEIDNDLFRQVLGLGPGVGDAGGDHLAHVTHLVGGKGREVGLFVPGKAGRRAHGAHALHVGVVEDLGANGVWNLEARDPGVGDGAAQERHFLEARHRHIADEIAAPTHVAAIFLARQARADSLGAHSSLSGSHDFRRREPRTARRTSLSRYRRDARFNPSR